MLRDGSKPERDDAFTESNLAMTSPVALQTLLDAESKDTNRNVERVIAVAGGRLPASLRDRALERLCRRILLVYGSTEVGGIAEGDASLIDRHPGAVGFVRAGATLQVIDAAGNPVPAGVNGIVRVRSDSMATGYVNDPDITEKFFRDGWFYPGDQGVVFDDGLVAITGRVSEILNLGGVKVSPDVIETLVASLPKVRDVCALAVPNRQGVERLVIVVVCDDAVDMKALRAGIKKRLARPRQFLLARVPNIPRNTMGKIPRPRLAAQIAAALEKRQSDPG